VYGIHLLTTIASINIGFFTEMELFFTQLPFTIISVIGVILLPINRYNRNNREKLEQLLEDAKSTMRIIEEDQRIVLDLHDTLVQIVCLSGLKSDLAGKLNYRAPGYGKRDIDDIHRTVRREVKEVRGMVSNMRAVKLEDELI